MSGQIEAGRIVLPDEAPWLAEFEHEVAAFPSGKYDDQVDALTHLLRWAAPCKPPQIKSNYYTLGGGSRVIDRYREHTGVGVFGF